MPTPTPAPPIDTRHADARDAKAPQLSSRRPATLSDAHGLPRPTPAARPTANSGHSRLPASYPEPTVAVAPLVAVSLRDRCLTEAAQFLVDQLAALDAMTEDEAVHAFGCADADAARSYRRQLRSARRNAGRR